MKAAPSLPPEELRRLRDGVIDLWAQGLDPKDIAEFVGYSFEWVDREIRKHLDRQIAAGKTERRA